MGLVMVIAKQISPHTFPGLILTSLSGASTYLIVLLFVFKINIMNEAAQLFKR